MEKNIQKQGSQAPAGAEGLGEEALGALTRIVAGYFDEQFERDFEQLSAWQRMQTVQRYVWYLMQQPKDNPAKAEPADPGDAEGIRLFIPKR